MVSGHWQDQGQQPHHRIKADSPHTAAKRTSLLDASLDAFAAASAPQETEDSTVVCVQQPNGLHNEVGDADLLEDIEQKLVGDAGESSLLI